MIVRIFSDNTCSTEQHNEVLYGVIDVRRTLWQCKTVVNDVIMFLDPMTIETNY